MSEPLDVLAAQVRGAIDSQRWLLNNAHNFQSQSWGEYLRAATADAENGYAALDALVARVTEAEANAEERHETAMRQFDIANELRTALADARNALEKASNALFVAAVARPDSPVYREALKVAREVLARLDGNQP